jgi:ABC-2 type transport system permease protein
MSAAVLGAAYVIRAAGDSLESGGSLLSWFSPLAWSQQTRAYVDGRWWPLLLSVGFAVVTAAVAYVLAGRRDLDAGLVAARRGKPEAAPWLRTPLAFAFRLHRSSMYGWGTGLVLSALLYGAITQPVVDAVEDLPDIVIDVLGGDASQMLDGYMSTMALIYALVVAVPLILGVQTARNEETRGRAEPVLATATSRVAWLGSHLAVLAMIAVVLLAASGLALGLTTALSVGDAAWIWETTAATLAYLPALLVMLAIAAVLFGFAPGAIGVTWAVFGFAALIGFFGSIMDLPQWVYDLSPFEHVSRLPLDTINWAPLIILTLIAAVVAGAGLLGFRRRDLDTK